MFKNLEDLRDWHITQIAKYSRLSEINRSAASDERNESIAKKLEKIAKGQDKHVEVHTAAVSILTNPATVLKELFENAGHVVDQESFAKAGVYCATTSPSAEPVITQKARIGCTVFGTGCKVSTVLNRAYHEYEIKRSKAIPANALCFVNTGDNETSGYMLQPDSAETNKHVAEICKGSVKNVIAFDPLYTPRIGDKLFIHPPTKPQRITKQDAMTIAWSASFSLGVKYGRDLHEALNKWWNWEDTGITILATLNEGCEPDYKPQRDELIDALKSIAESYPTTEEGETLAGIARDALTKVEAPEFREIPVNDPIFHFVAQHYPLTAETVERIYRECVHHHESREVNHVK